MSAKIILSLILAAALAIAVAASTDTVVKDVCADEWHGFVDTSVSDFSMSVNLRRSENSLCTGVISIPEREIIDAPLRNVTIDNDIISFATESRGIQLEFRGTLADGKQRIDGQLRQGTFSLSFKLARGAAVLASREVAPPPITSRNVEGLPSERASIASPDHPAIRYSASPTTDAVEELNRKLTDGNIRFKFDGALGYLRSTLDALNVSADSQMMVFSKTSVQAHLIGPSNPRALFFSDDVTVGFIRNAPFIELAALDPHQGVVFYTLQQNEAETPRFRRNNTCLTCHLSRNTMDIPGLRLRSVVTAPTGRTFDQFGDYRVDDRTPFEERWGGWYVTGAIKSAMHLGNAMLLDSHKPEALIKPDNLSVASLAGRFPNDAYPRDTSDIAALMVYEHQAQMTNLLVRVGWDARAALHQEKSGSNPQLTATLLRNNALETVDYMLFVDEVPLPGKVDSILAFASNFSAQGPRDKKGRSLRQLDLQKRLMRYPCSYMIYSNVFDTLPAEVKAAIYARMWQILSGSDKAKKYSRLSPADRRDVVEILRDTKSDLPSYFK